MDLLIDTHLHSGRAISHHVLYQDRVQMYCRAGHPALDGPQDETTLAEYEFALLLPEGQRYPTSIADYRKRWASAAAALAPLT